MEWVQAHAPRLVGEMTRCDFCFSWWMSWVVVVVALVVTGEWWLLGVPFCSTMIARLLVMEQIYRAQDIFQGGKYHHE